MQHLVQVMTMNDYDLFLITIVWQVTAIAINALALDKPNSGKNTPCKNLWSFTKFIKN